MSERHTVDLGFQYMLLSALELKEKAPNLTESMEKPLENKNETEQNQKNI